MYSVAAGMLSGSSGLGSVNMEMMDSNTFEMGRPGLQLSFRISMQMPPLRAQGVSTTGRTIHAGRQAGLTDVGLMLGWYSLVVKMSLGGVNGYSSGKWMKRWKTPPSYGESAGPAIVACHDCNIPPNRFAVHPGGGSR